MNKWFVVGLAVFVGVSLGLLNGCDYTVETPVSSQEYLGLPPSLSLDQARQIAEQIATEQGLALRQLVGSIEAAEARRDAVNAFGLSILGPLLDQIGTVAENTPVAGAAAGAAIVGLPALLAAFGVRRPGDVNRKDILTEYISRTEHAELLRQGKEASYNRGLADGLNAGKGAAS